MGMSHFFYRQTDTFNENGHNTFVAMDDYLVTDKITAFIVQMQNAATEVLIKE
jgi:peroxin-3